MKNNSYLFYGICFLFVLFLVGYLSNVNSLRSEVVLEIKGSNIEKIEIYHFHSTRQCNVCKTIGANLDETMERYFLEEVDSGKISYGHINIQDPGNSEITNRYGAVGTSLWIGVYDENGFHADNDKGIWYKLNDKEAFIDYLKNIIEKRLSGNIN
jgi:hypothetical protein